MLVVSQGFFDNPFRTSVTHVDFSHFSGNCHIYNVKCLDLIWKCEKKITLSLPDDSTGNLKICIIKQRKTKYLTISLLLFSRSLYLCWISWFLLWTHFLHISDFPHDILQHPGTISSLLIICGDESQSYHKSNMENGNCEENGKCCMRNEKWNLQDIKFLIFFVFTRYLT